LRVAGWELRVAGLRISKELSTEVRLSYQMKACCGLVIGYWLLVIGYWLLVIGYWLLGIGLIFALCPIIHY
jgi:hypothetical protein